MEANKHASKQAGREEDAVRVSQTQHRLPGKQDLPCGLEASVVGSVGPWAQKALPLIYLQLGL